MENQNQKPESKNKPGEPRAFDEKQVQYDSALKPLLWLLVPFVLVLLYGLFGN